VSKKVDPALTIQLATSLGIVIPLSLGLTIAVVTPMREFFSTLLFLLLENEGRLSNLSFSTAVCLAGWTQVGAWCFYSPGSLKSSSDAETECVNLGVGAHLPSFIDLNEVSLFQNFL
jgi:hypothetical protein